MIKLQEGKRKRWGGCRWIGYEGRGGRRKGRIEREEKLAVQESFSIPRTSRDNGGFSLKIEQI